MLHVASVCHSRPQSPPFLGHVVGKRGVTGRLQIKPSGSGDENVRLHTLSSCCCALLGVVAQSLKSVKLLARECWVRLHVAVDFSMLLAERFWRETVLLLDVM